MAWSRADQGLGRLCDPHRRPRRPGEPPRRLSGHRARSLPPTSRADKSRILIARNLSNRETRLSMLDLATGQATELPWTSDPARYEDGRFRARRHERSSPSPTTAATCAAWSRSTWRPASARHSRPISNGTSNTTNCPTTAGSSPMPSTRTAIRALHDRRPSSGRELPRPELPGGVLTGCKFSPDGRRLAISMSTATSAGDVWTWDVAGGKLTRWTTSELGGLDPKTPRRAAS